jgi:hypothetical protein
VRRDNLSRDNFESKALELWPKSSGDGCGHHAHLYLAYM